MEWLRALIFRAVGSSPAWVKLSSVWSDQVCFFLITDSAQ